MVFAAGLPPEHTRTTHSQAFGPTIHKAAAIEHVRLD